MMDILVTNDDGILAEGLLALRRALEPLGRLWVVAPEQEQSAASHALTLHRPLRMRQISDRVFSVDGTPTDCVLLACRRVPELSGADIQMVVSGINHGANLGDDVTYSGTVAAAIEGRMMGRVSVAFSMVDWRPGGFDPAARVAQRIVAKLMAAGAPDGALLNVNIPSVPDSPIRGFRVTRLGRRTYNDRIESMADPRGRPYYWIGGDAPSWEEQPGSDFEAIDAGYVSITPIHLDLTNYGSMDLLRRWGLEEEPPIARSDRGRPENAVE